MKHIEIDGQMINLDKKAHHLSKKQKEKTYNDFKRIIKNFYLREHKFPDKLKLKILINLYHDEINYYLPHNEYIKMMIGNMPKIKKAILKEVESEGTNDE